MKVQNIGRPCQKRKLAEREGGGKEWEGRGGEWRRGKERGRARKRGREKGGGGEENERERRERGGEEKRREEGEMIGGEGSLWEGRKRKPEFLLRVFLSYIQPEGYPK